MGKKGHSEEEVLRESESGDTVVEICRKHGRTTSLVLSGFRLEPKKNQDRHRGVRSIFA